MSYPPKLLAQITIASDLDFVFNLGGAKTATVAAGTYATILEIADELEDQLKVHNANFFVTVTANGKVVILNAASAWTVTWASTDDDLSAMLGYDESEAVAGVLNSLSGTNRHLYGFYVPVGAKWPADELEIVAKIQDTDDGGMTQFASSGEHHRRDLTISLLSYEQLEAGGSDDDGRGGTTDWSDITLKDFWKYIKDKPFRFYADATVGSVATPGTEGVEYVTCRRTDTKWKPTQPDDGDWSFFDVTIPLKIVGS